MTVGQKYQVTGKYAIARPGKLDARPADPAAGRAEGDVFDVAELDPATRVDALVKGRLIAPVEDKPAAKPAEKKP
ncbi:MAG: hypothetical protein ACRDPR_17565 [Nocardioidaceae bacterium]